MRQIALANSLIVIMLTILCAVFIFYGQLETHPNDLLMPANWTTLIVATARSAQFLLEMHLMPLLYPRIPRPVLRIVAEYSL